MIKGFFHEIHDDGKAPSCAFHVHGHLSSRPAVNLLHEDASDRDRAQCWALYDHEHLIRRPAADLLHDDGTTQSWVLHGHGHRISRPAKCRYRTSSELGNSVLEINHVTNVTKVLNETTASDRVSRYLRP